MNGDKKFILRIFALSLLIVALLGLSLSLFFTGYYALKAEPLSLMEEMHPLYWIGMVALALLVPVSMHKLKPLSRINIHLIVALLATLYLTLIPIAIYEFPLTRHTSHVVPISYILRHGNVNLTEYPGHSETVAPQLFFSMFHQVTSYSGVEIGTYLSLTLIPMLFALFTYLIARRLTSRSDLAMMTTIWAMVLMYRVYGLKRPIYVMPLFGLVILIVLLAFRRRSKAYSVIALIAITTVALTDPAHSLFIVTGLAVFPLINSMFSYINKSRDERSMQYLNLASFSAVVFFSWMIARSLVGLGGIFDRVWNAIVVSFTELGPELYPTIGPELASQVTFWNEFRIGFTVISVFLPIILLAYALSHERLKNKIYTGEMGLLVSFFLPVIITLGLRLYRMVYPVLASLITFYAFAQLAGYKLNDGTSHRLIPAKNVSSSRHQRSHRWGILEVLLCSLLLTSFVTAPQITYMLNAKGTGFPSSEISQSLWIGHHNPNEASKVSLGSGSGISDIAYIYGGAGVKVAEFFPVVHRGQNITIERLRELMNYDVIIISRYILMVNTVYKTDIPAPKAVEITTKWLNDKRYRLVYNAESPYYTVWSRF